MLTAGTRAALAVFDDVAELAPGEWCGWTKAGAMVVIRAPRPVRTSAHRAAVHEAHRVRPYRLPRFARTSASVKDRIALRKWRDLRPYWQWEQASWIPGRRCRCAELLDRSHRPDLF